MLTRRQILGAGGALAAGFFLPTARVHAAEIVEIHMRGLKDGSQVWFDPIGLLVQPGQTIRWINTDPGNSHTSTAYHPRNDDHALRIPETAEPWNSDYLLPGDRFTVTLTTEGVYDYYCIPHEHAGMVGRIIVGRAIGPGAGPFDASHPVPEIAQKTFPPVREILASKIVRYKAPA